MNVASIRADVMAGVAPEHSSSQPVPPDWHFSTRIEQVTASGYLSVYSWQFTDGSVMAELETFIDFDDVVWG